MRTHVRERPSDRPLIHARGLTKRFGDFTAVDAIDFDVAPGESFGFLGPNGAGKTSTMRMIGCVSPITAGTLVVMGLDPAAHGPRIRARLGVVPQQDTLDNELTVRENLVDLRSLLRPEPCRGRPPRRRAARVRPADRASRRPGRAAVGRDEATADDRPLAHQRADGAPARRADDRARSAGPAPALGSPLPAEAARRHAGPDDPLHGRGRAAVRPARRHGQGEDRRRGQPARRSSSATRRAR